MKRKHKVNNSHKYYDPNMVMFFPINITYVLYIFECICNVYEINLF